MLGRTRGPGRRAAPGPAGCGTGSWIAGTVDLCDGGSSTATTSTTTTARRAPRSRRSTGSLSNPTGTRATRRTADGTVNNYADLAALRLRVVGRPAARVVRAQLAVRRGQHRRRARDRHRRQRGDRRRRLVRPVAVAFPDGAGSPAAARARAGRSSTCSRRAIPATNRIEGAIPLPPGTHWRVQAVTAVASRAHRDERRVPRQGEAGTLVRGPARRPRSSGRHLAVRRHGRGREAARRRHRAAPIRVPATTSASTPPTTRSREGRAARSSTTRAPRA